MIKTRSPPDQLIINPGPAASVISSLGRVISYRRVIEAMHIVEEAASRYPFSANISNSTFNLI